MDGKLDIKKATHRVILATILIVIAFSSLVVAALMQEQGVSDTVMIPTALVIFLGGDIIALILLVKSYPALVYADCMKMEKKYSRQELTQVLLPDQSSIGQVFLGHKFKYIEEGYYRRKKLSFLKDSVNYYARITEDFEIENALKREVDRLFEGKRKEKNLCLLLFVYMDEIGEREKKEIKELSKNQIIMGSVVNPNISVAVLVIAVDRKMNQGYYMESGKRGGISLYSYGCRMAGKLFKVISESEIEATLPEQEKEDGLIVQDNK